MSVEFTFATLLDASQNVVQNDAPQNNKAVDISKINNELGEIARL